MNKSRQLRLARTESKRSKQRAEPTKDLNLHRNGLTRADLLTLYQDEGESVGKGAGDNGTGDGVFQVSDGSVNVSGNPSGPRGRPEGAGDGVFQVSDGSVNVNGKPSGPRGRSEVATGAEETAPETREVPMVEIAMEVVELTVTEGDAGMAVVAEVDVLIVDEVTTVVSVVSDGSVGVELVTTEEDDADGSGVATTATTPRSLGLMRAWRLSRTGWKRRLRRILRSPIRGV